MAEKYVRVPKTELKENADYVRTEIIGPLRNILKPEIKFQDILVGSSAKGMAVRDGNGFYDFDFRLELSEKSKVDLNDGNQVRKLILKAFNHLGFHGIENSTTAITIRFPKKGFSVDFVIIRKQDGRDFVLKRNSPPQSKDCNLYQWEGLPTKFAHVYEKFNQLSGEEREKIASLVVDAKIVNLHQPQKKRKPSWAIFVEEVYRYVPKSRK